MTLDAIAGEPIVTSIHCPQRLRDYWAGVDDGADPSYEVSELADGPGARLSALGEGRGVSLCPANAKRYVEAHRLSKSHLLRTHTLGRAIPIQHDPGRRGC